MALNSLCFGSGNSAIGDLLLKIYLAKILLESNVICTYDKNSFTRPDAPRLPRKEYRFLQEKIYVVNGIEQSFGDCPFYLEHPEYLKDRRFLLIYESLVHYVCQMIGVPKTDFSHDGICGFLSICDSDYQQIVFDNISQIGCDVIFVGPVGIKGYPSPNASHRYIPPNIYRQILLLAKKKLPGFKFVSVGEPRKLSRTSLEFEFDMDLVGKFNLYEYYNIAKFYPQIGTVGSLVHLANGFSKQDALVVFGGVESHQWHYHPSMSFVACFPEVSCNCFKHAKNECQYFPGCFEDKYLPERLHASVDLFVERVIETRECRKSFVPNQYFKPI